MNTMQRMRRTNRIIQKELKKLGYFDIVMFPHTRYFKDVWGLWDGVCKNPVDVHGNFDVYWLQFKTGYASVKEKRAMSRFCKLSGEKALLCELKKRRIKYKNKKGRYSKSVVNITGGRG